MIQTLHSRKAFFDSIADKWDAHEDMDILSDRLLHGLNSFGIGPSESILDVGCGTGNLTLALLKRLSPEGRVIAVDISRMMLKRAKTKISDPRVEWHLASADQLPLPDECIDRVICLSVWPHFVDPYDTALELSRVLKTEGWIHVWHLIPRDEVNRIHSEASDIVRKDLLPPADEASQVLSFSGFEVTALLDDHTGYLISARKKQTVKKTGRMNIFKPMDVFSS